MRDGLVQGRGRIGSHPACYEGPGIQTQGLTAYRHTPYHWAISHAHIPSVPLLILEHLGSLGFGWVGVELL